MRTPALVAIVLVVGFGLRTDTMKGHQGRAIEPGATISGQIRGGESHDYHIAARAGQAIDLRVTQIGIDLVLVLQDGNGATIVEVDSPNGSQGDEAASVVADRAGVYRARVMARTPHVAAGRYEIRTAVRAATPRDLELTAVQKSYTAARRLLATGAERDAAAAVSDLRAAMTGARAIGATDLVQGMAADVGSRHPAILFEALGIPMLPGPVPVYVSRGFEVRARALRDRLARAVDHFDARLKIRPAVALVVLTKDDWQVAVAGPYGLPFTNDSPSPLIYMPTEHALFEEFAAAMKQQGVPSGATAQAVSRTGLSLEQGLSLAADDIIYHELGHILAGRYGVAQPNRWFGEFLANYFMEAYLAETARDPRAPIFEEVMREWTAGQVPTYTSLDDLERLYDEGLGTANYAWYQVNIQARARDVYKAQGLAFLSRLKTAFPEGTRPSLPVFDVLARLDAIAPGFQAWARALTERKRQ
jgi:hypothetical protein